MPFLHRYYVQFHSPSTNTASSSSTFTMHNNSTNPFSFRRLRDLGWGEFHTRLSETLCKSQNHVYKPLQYWRLRGWIEKHIIGDANALSAVMDILHHVCQLTQWKGWNISRLTGLKGQFYTGNAWNVHGRLQLIKQWENEEKHSIFSTGSRDWWAHHHTDKY